MASDAGDFTLASAAAGFTLGFGFLCVWNAIQQSRAVRSPLRSAYIYMVWGEIASNLAIGVIGWLFLDGVIKLGVPVLFSLLFCWVFEVQLLMQIIINRIQVVADNPRLMRNLKAWGTALVITLINIAVFIIWIPAHLIPPPIPVLVTVNRYWDRTSKVLILIVDAGLNYFFLRTVNLRLVKHHGLTRYAALVRFNARLMVLSVSMDVMLICLMFLQNQVVYIQFHPVTYMVKLNIEMSMASLITRIAKDTVQDRNNELRYQYATQNRVRTYTQGTLAASEMSVEMKAPGPTKYATTRDVRGNLREIKMCSDVIVEDIPDNLVGSSSDDGSGTFDREVVSSDEIRLTPPAVPLKERYGPTRDKTSFY